jgi:hypothetical protein
MLEKEIALHADFIIWHALISPRIEFNAVTVEALGDGAYHVGVVVQNTGWLPTSVSGRAQEKSLVRPLEVEINLPDGATLVSGLRRVEAGQLAGRALKLNAIDPSDPTNERVKVDWVVRATKGSSVTVKAVSQRAGTITREVQLM